MSVPPLRRAALAGLVAMALAPVCCRGAREARPPDPAAPAAPSGSARAEAAGVDRVVLTAEAERLAGIETEVANVTPFAVNVSVPCRLSPEAETPDEIEAHLDGQAARAREVRTVAELDRLRELLARGVVATKAVQDAEAEAAQARVDSRRAAAALERLGLAPDGAEGRYPAADIWALAEIDEAHAGAVAAGDRAWIQVESFPGTQFLGRLVALARFVKPDTRTLTGRIAVEDPRRRLRPQSLGTASIEVARREALSVPSSALLYADAGRILFVRRGDGYERADVRVGAEAGGRTEILAGLEPGETVVARGASRIWGEWLKARNAGPAGDGDDVRTGGRDGDGGP